MTETYHFSYDPIGVGGHVLELIQRLNLPTGGVVVDLGCGYGAMAEPLTELGFVYLGLDRDTGGLKDLKDRGFETLVADLADLANTVDAVTQVLANRRLALILGMDVIEHLVNHDDVLRAMHALSLDNGGAPLVLSVPNVTHYDLAAKLLMGRWDVTATGLLDNTHVSFFTAKRLRSTTGAAGWIECGALDFELAKSDQHFPADVALLASTPLRSFLMNLRTESDEGALVNQFIRAYVPTPAPVVDSRSRGHGEVFLSVLLRTQGTRMPTLEETLLSLAAQTCRDFEVIVLAHDVDAAARDAISDLIARFAEPLSTRIRLLPVNGGGRARPLNAGIAEAQGRYVAFIDDDDVAFAHWVEVFKRDSQRHPGNIIRSMVAEQDVTSDTWGERLAYRVDSRPSCSWPEQFDHVIHLYQNLTPFCGLAIPRTCFSELHIRFDESLPVLEDWDLLMRAAPVCGIFDTREVTSLYRRWKESHSSSHVHSQSEWRRTRETVLNKLDCEPLLMPPGTVSRLNELIDEVQDLKIELQQVTTERDMNASQADRAVREVEAIHGTISWQLTSPLRVIRTVASRIRGRRRT